MGHETLAPLVRHARLEDLRTIASFNLMLALETEGKALDPEVVRRGVEAALADPDRLRYWVAEVDRQVVAQSAATREWSDWRNGWIWWLQSVYVAPEFRTRGIFRALFRHVRTEAHAAGNVVGLRLYVEDENRRAQRVYEALGLRPGGYQVFEDVWHDPRFDPDSPGAS